MIIIRKKVTNIGKVKTPELFDRLML